MLCSREIFRPDRVNFRLDPIDRGVRKSSLTLETIGRALINYPGFSQILDSDLGSWGFNGDCDRGELFLFMRWILGYCKDNQSFQAGLAKGEEEGIPPWVIFYSPGILCAIMERFTLEEFEDSPPEGEWCRNESNKFDITDKSSNLAISHISALPFRKKGGKKFTTRVRVECFNYLSSRSESDEPGFHSALIGAETRFKSTLRLLLFLEEVLNQRKSEKKLSTIVSVFKRSDWHWEIFIDLPMLFPMLYEGVKCVSQEMAAYQRESLVATMNLHLAKLHLSLF